MPIPFPNPPPSHILTPYHHPQTLPNPHLHLEIPTNPTSSKMKSPQNNSTINNPTDPPNHLQLIFTYPPLASSLSPPQTQHTISPLTQSFHPSSPSRNNLWILQWNANGIRPRRTELIQFLSKSVWSHLRARVALSSDSTFLIPGYKTLQKNRSMTKRETTVSTGNLGDGVLILVKNGLTYNLLSTQLLSSLDPSSDYLAITVKIKGASPIHLFQCLCPSYPLFFLWLSS